MTISLVEKLTLELCNWRIKRKIAIADIENLAYNAESKNLLNQVIEMAQKVISLESEEEERGEKREIDRIEIINSHRSMIKLMTFSKASIRNMISNLENTIKIEFRDFQNLEEFRIEREIVTGILKFNDRLVVLVTDNLSNMIVSNDSSHQPSAFNSFLLGSDLKSSSFKHHQRGKKRFDKKSIEALKRLIQRENNFPSIENRRLLAIELGLPLRQINNWYSVNRYRFKKRCESLINKQKSHSISINHYKVPLDDKESKENDRNGNNDSENACINYHHCDNDNENSIWNSSFSTNNFTDESYYHGIVPLSSSYSSPSLNDSSWQNEECANEIPSVDSLDHEFDNNETTINDLINDFCQKNQEMTISIDSLFDACFNLFN